MKKMQFVPLTLFIIAMFLFWGSAVLAQTLNSSTNNSATAGKSIVARNPAIAKKGASMSVEPIRYSEKTIIKTQPASIGEIRERNNSICLPKNYDDSKTNITSKP